MSSSVHTFSILEGDCLERLRDLEPESVDSVVTDPPYGLSQHSASDVQAAYERWRDGDRYEHHKAGFMDHAWDSFVPGPEVWREVIRVLKPGGYIAAFSATRTLDLMAASMAWAGFLPVDVLAWCFPTGYPKSLGISQAVDKMGGMPEAVWKFTAWMRSTGVKAADVNKATNSFMASHYLTKGSQPAIPSREHWEAIKPLLAHIDIPSEIEEMVSSKPLKAARGSGVKPKFMKFKHRQDYEEYVPTSDSGRRWHGWGTALKPAWEPISLMRKAGGAPHTLCGPRFFSCGKASRTDRDEGLESLQSCEESGRKNSHPTVKPTVLMEWLCTLTTPPGGVILDPFMGSGSTGKAAIRQGFSFVGVERDPEYANISRCRIQHAVNSFGAAPASSPVLSLFDL